ncbi:MAG: ABC transporter ATP-binding protein [Ruminococcus sp.]|nr:ABC transporter ATP-binding protein [Ruminococcus sp.]
MKIEVKELTKILSGNKIIDNINITMKSGKVYGLCGYNGCGKTMLMRLIAGLITPTSGSVSYDGQILGKKLNFPPSIGILIENPAFLDSRSGFDNLKLLASIKGKADKDKIADTIRRVGLDPDDKKKYRKYSLGMKQRLGIAAAIMESPDLVILDEPTNALDSKGVELTQNLIRKECERGALVIMTCHDREILENVSDVIYTIEHGRIIDERGVQS